MADIYLLIDGAQQGPFTEEQLTKFIAQGRIGNNQSAWREGLTSWVAVESLLPQTAKPREETQAEVKSPEVAPVSNDLKETAPVADIHLLFKGAWQGPFTLEKVRRYLAEGRITNEQRAYREGFTEWVAVESLLPEAAKPKEESPTEAKSQKVAPTSTELNGATAVADIYLLVGGAQQGPFRMDQVKRYIAQGRIGSDQPARRIGMEEWVGVEGLLAEPIKPAEESHIAKQVPVEQKSQEPPKAIIAPGDTSGKSSAPPSSKESIPVAQSKTVPQTVGAPGKTSDKASTPSESIQDSMQQPVADPKPKKGKKPKTEKKSSLKIGWKALVGFSILIIGIIVAVVVVIWHKQSDVSHDDLTEMLRLHATQPRMVETPSSLTTSAAPPANQPKTVVIDRDMRVNGIPIFSPIFQIESSEVTFKGGDYRNTVLDFRNTETKAFAMAEVLSDVGCYGTGDQKKYGIGVLLDENDRRAFFDENWVYYPGSLRKVDPEGPFATVFVVCTNKGSPAEGMQVEMGGMQKQTAKNGWAQFNLKNIQNQIMTVKVTVPNSDKIVERIVALPIASASGKLNEKYNIYNVVYKTLAIELTQ